MTAKKSSRRDDVGQCHGLGTDISDEMLFPVKRSHRLGSQDIRMQEDFMEINSTEKNSCIKCNRSGKLLVCSDRGCPIAVHEKCMNCSARFDDTTNFYCPYCSYRRALEESCQARQKATLAKKALSIFIDRETTNSNLQKEKTSTTTNRQDISPSTVGGSNGFDNQSVDLQEDQEVASVPKCSERKLPCNKADEYLGNKLYEVSVKMCGDNARVSDSDKEMINLYETTEVGRKLRAGDQGKIDEKLQEKILEDGEVNFSTEEKLENGEGIREEEVQPALIIRSKVNTDVEAGDSVCRDIELSPKHAEDTDKDRVPILNDGSPMRTFANSASKLTSIAQNEKIITSNMVTKLEISSRKRTNTLSPNARRKNLPWSDEEEEMLREGVQKFSSRANKNLPWRKVLEFGRHVFDATRTPVDLKDKWRRNMLAKESSKR